MSGYISAIYKKGVRPGRPAAHFFEKAAGVLAAACLLAFTPVHARAGDSVACFQSTASAKAVRDAGGKIPSSLLPEITSIEALVLRTARGSVASPEVPTRLLALRSDEKVDSYLSRFTSRLASTLPALADRFRAAHAVLLPKGAYYSIQSVDRSVLPRTGSGAPSVDGVADLHLSSRCVLTRLTVGVQSDSGAFIQVDRRLFQHPRHSRFSQVALLLERLLEFDPATRLIAPSSSGPLSAERMMLGALLLESPRPSVLELETLAIDLGFLKGEGVQWQSRVEREFDERLVRLAHLAQAAFDEFDRSQLEAQAVLLFDVNRDRPWGPVNTDIAAGLQQVEAELWNREAAGHANLDYARQQRQESLRHRLSLLIEQRRRAIQSALESALSSDVQLQTSPRVAPGAPEASLERFQAQLLQNARVMALMSGFPEPSRNPFLNREFERIERYLGQYPLAAAIEGASASRSENPGLDDYPMPTSEQIEASFR